ncbi:MAG: hypothetical protein HKN20_02375 [Gemmatimonadetes bacterium]|nr:hypothetical protein [Gemmatimonadota bacterium]
MIPVRRIAMLMLAAAAVAGSPDRARADAFAEAPAWDIAYSFSLRNWKLVRGSEELKISEITSPLSITRRINEGGNVALYLAGASATSDGEEKQDISGMQDARLTWSQLLDGDRYHLRAGLGLPTGKAEIESGSEIVSGVVSNRILGLRTKRYGEGFNAFASGARAFAIGDDAVASFGAGFERKGKYDFQVLNDETIEIQPGNEFFLEAGIDVAPGDLVAWSADIRYRLFGIDQRDGEDVYEEGDEIDLLGGVTITPSDIQTFAIGARVIVKGDGSEVGGIGEGPLDSLSLDRYLTESLPGGMQRLSVDYARRMNEVLHLLGRAGYRHYSEYSFPGEAPPTRLLGSAQVWEAGIGARFAPAPSLPVTLFLTYSNGNAEDALIDISGIDLTLALRWRQ